MRLEEAQKIAQRVCLLLRPYCTRMLTVGSIRRGKPLVHDIDIVLIPRSEALSMFNRRLASIGSLELNGPKIKRLRHAQGG